MMAQAIADAGAAKVYIAGRNETAGAAAVKDLTRVTGRTPIFHKLDLANLKAIKASAEDFKTCTIFYYIFPNSGC